MLLLLYAMIVILFFYKKSVSVFPTYNIFFFVILLPISSHIFVNSQLFGLFVSFFHNFSFQMIFICDNITIPFGDGLFFANPNLVGNLQKNGFLIKNSSFEMFISLLFSFG